MKLDAEETLGLRLQRLRAAAGLTQQQLAMIAGVEHNSLRSWEIDHREPGWRALVRLAKSLGVSVESFADTVPKKVALKIPRRAGPTRIGEMTLAAAQAIEASVAAAKRKSAVENGRGLASPAAPDQNQQEAGGWSAGESGPTQ